MATPGPVFDLPVDSEHKATRMKLLSFGNPHMRAFHLSWMAFFTVFLSTFGPASMLPVIRQSLNMTKTELGNAGIAAVCGAIASRVLLGNFLDTFGPRYGLSFVLLFTAPPVFCIGLVQDATGFVVCRLLIGIGLAAFVACQFWCSNMFNAKIVGTANAFAAGWGNMGGGATHFILPLVMHALEDTHPSFRAWRWTFVLPGLMHLVMGAAVLLFSQDLPDGDYRELKAAGLMNKPKGTGALKAAVLNYRTWIFTITYGYCFGVELTVDNVISQYLYDQFNVSVHTAGMLGSVFGLMNIFTRASGGVVSDIAAKYYGMQGRLWVHWLIQSLGGVFCVVLAFVDGSLGATMAIIVVFSIFCQQACGTSFGIVPFISKRGLGQASGLVGAGGNAGSAVTQAIFFTNNPMSVQKGFEWMGVMTIAITALTFLVYFPMWGGMFCGPKEGVTEEDYYLAEYSAEERAQGMHSASLKFAYESKSQRGWVKGQEAQAAMQKDADVGKAGDIKVAGV